jgi:hypothetical protein
VIQVKSLYNSGMVMFRREPTPEDSYEPGQYVRHTEARPGNGWDPVVEVVEDLGTIEIPCGKVDCRSDCLEYIVRSARTLPRRDQDYDNYNLAGCKLGPLVSIL